MASDGEIKGRIPRKGGSILNALSAMTLRCMADLILLGNIIIAGSAKAIV
jgi:hypothetical protein